jgi:hypothetical protein
MQLLAGSGRTNFPALSWSAIFERKHRGTEAKITECPSLVGSPNLDCRTVIALPDCEKVKDWTQSLNICWFVVVNRKRQIGIAVGCERCWKVGVPVQKKPVGQDANARGRPILPSQYDEFGKTGMHSWFAPEEIQLFYSDPLAPCAYPTFRLR